MSDREKTIEHEMNYCQHYHVERCDISCNEGVDRHSVQVPLSELTPHTHSQPCLYGHLLDDAKSYCEYWVRRTREQGEKRADNTEKSFDRILKVLPIVSEWKKKEPIGKSETVECPICKGKLHLSQAACNGHVHGKCETKDCVSWME